MSDPRPAPGLRGGAQALAALLAVLVLWFSRDVLTAEVGLRLVLPAAWLSAWTVSCLGLGVRPTRLLLGRDGALDAVVVLATGAAVLALVGSLLATVGMFHPPIVIAVLVIGGLEGVRQLARGGVRLRLPELEPRSAPAILLVGAAAVVLALASAPPIMYDTLNYHLAFPSQWLDAGTLVDFPRQSFSYYPSAHGMLYAAALATVGPWGAQAIHIWMAALAVAAAATLGGRLAGRTAATWSAAIFGLTPAVLEIAGYAIADLAVAGWAGAALVALTDDRDGVRPWRAAAVAGALAGSAVAAKILALALVVVPVGAAAAALLWRRGGPGFRGLWPAGLAFTLAAGLAVAPWFGRNIVLTGNPTYPYLQGLFGGPPCSWDVSAELGPYAEPGGSPARWLLSAVTALAVRTVHPLREAGLLGPLWLILLPVAAFARGVERRLAVALWLATLTGLAAWGALVQYARFLVPVLVPAAALAGAAAASLTSNGGAVARIAFRTLLVGVLAWNATVLASRLNLDRAAAVTGHSSRQEFLDRWVSYAPAIGPARDAVGRDGRLLLVGEARSLYLPGRVLVEDPYRTPWLAELARGCATSAELAARVRALGATHVLVNAAEMPRLASQRGATDYWQGANREERAVIDRFLRAELRPLFRSGGLWLGEVPAGPLPPAG